MTNLPRIKNREDLPKEGWAAYDEIVGSRGGVSGPFSVLLNSPEAGRRIGHLGAYIRFESSLPGEVTELAILVTAREWGCQYEWTYHEPLAREAGVREEAIAAVRDRTAPSGLDEGEALVVRYVQETIREHKASNEARGAVLERFGARGAVDLTATTGYYAMLAGALNTFEVPLEPGDGPLLPL